MVKTIAVKSLLLCVHYLLDSESLSGLRPPDGLCVDVFTMLCDVIVNDAHVEAFPGLVWSMCKLTDAHHPFRC